MDSMDISNGLKEELYAGIVQGLNGYDRNIVEQYSPRDLTLYQRTNGRGIVWCDARYLWLRLNRQVEGRDLVTTLQRFSHCVVVQEDAVLEMVNGLREEHRRRLLSAA